MLYALQNDVEQACTWLRKAIAMSDKNIGMAQTDSDFDTIRDTPEFQALMQEFGDKSGLVLSSRGNPPTQEVKQLQRGENHPSAGSRTTSARLVHLTNSSTLDRLCRKAGPIAFIVTNFSTARVAGCPLW